MIDPETTPRLLIGGPYDGQVVNTAGPPEDWSAFNPGQSILTIGDGEDAALYVPLPPSPHLSLELPDNAVEAFVYAPIA